MKELALGQTTGERTSLQLHLCQGLAGNSDPQKSTLPDDQRLEKIQDQDLKMNEEREEAGGWTSQDTQRRLLPPM